MATKDKVTVDLMTGVGTLSFPHLSEEAAKKNLNDKKEPVYDVQIIIPKSDKAAVRALLLAIKEVGEAKWGANWKKARNPLRDGDKEKDELTEDGSTKGEKYPERLGCYFLNARSTRVVPVVGRDRSPINPDEVYGGCKGRLNVTFYAYAQQGNIGVGVGLNGVQKVADGEPFGAGATSVESMFDLLDDEDDLDFTEEEEIEEEEAPKPAKKAAKKPAKKAAAKKAEPVEVDEDEDDLYDDLDDEDDDI